MSRVLLVGFAGIGGQDHQTAMYGPAFEKHPEFTVVGVCAGPDEPGSAAKTAAGRLDVPQYESFDQADFDVASVAVGLPHRAAIITQLLRAGKHVLADKPLAASLAETEAIAEAAALSKRVLVPAHHQRLHGSIRSATAALGAGRVGLPWNVQADFLVAGGDVAPTGELVNLALYPVDVLHAMLGLSVTRVFARSGRYWNSEADDFVALMLDYAHGVTGTITVGRTGAARDTQPGGLTKHRYRVSGSHGVLLVDALKPALDLHTADAQERRWIGPGTIDALLDVLHRGIQTGLPDIAVTDAVHTHQVIEAAERSLRSGAPERT